MVEQAEAYLISLGYATMRVRYENNMARIEMPKEDALRFMNDEQFRVMVENLKSFGFSHIMFDLEGYCYERSYKER